MQLRIAVDGLSSQLQMYTRLDRTEAEGEEALAAAGSAYRELREIAARIGDRLIEEVTGTPPRRWVYELLQLAGRAYRETRQGWHVPDVIAEFAAKADDLHLFHELHRASAVDSPKLAKQARGRPIKKHSEDHEELLLEIADAVVATQIFLDRNEKLCNDLDRIFANQKYSGWDGTRQPAELRRQFKTATKTYQERRFRTQKIVEKLREIRKDLHA